MRSVVSGAAAVSMRMFSGWSSESNSDIQGSSSVCNSSEMVSYYQKVAIYNIVGLTCSASRKKKFAIFVACVSTW